MSEPPTLLLGDCFEVLQTLEAESVDACVCDPPYSLGFMGKSWDKHDSPLAFQQWCEKWAREVYRVLKPGAHLIAFGGTRTYHRLACGVEDAGFECRDSVHWVFGSGFPKSLNISKALDKAAGAEREVLGAGPFESRRPRPTKETNIPGAEYGFNAGDTITAPATQAAKQWDGWGTALKPAHEIAVLARKPLASAGVNVLVMVEHQLRERGAEGEISWIDENASGAEQPSGTRISSETPAPQAAATSAESVGASATVSEDRPTETRSGKSTKRGGTPTGSTLERTTSENEKRSGTKCSRPTAASAIAAESESEISSPLITSTEAERSTGAQSTARSTTRSGEKVSPTGTESFAGIATGLTGSMEHVRIRRDQSGRYVWPANLPRFVAGSKQTVAQNVLEHGTGGLNIDGCRIPGEVPSTVQGQSSRQGEVYGADQRDRRLFEGHASGRWPANVIHSGDDEVLAEFAKYGERSSGTGNKNTQNRNRNVFGNGLGAGSGEGIGGDTGTAARFFYAAKSSKDDRNDGLDSVELVTVECSAWEDAGQKAVLRVDTAPSVPRVIGVSGAPMNDATAWSTFLFGSDTTDPCPMAITSIIETETSSTMTSPTLRWLRRSHTSDTIAAANGEAMNGGSLAASAELGTPSLTITSEWTVSARGVERAASPMQLRISASAKRAADHPTVKPTSLMRYLVRLVCPKGGLVLDPFAGSGTTLIAAYREDCRAVGIELDPDYFKMASHRIDKATAQLRLEL